MAILLLSYILFLNNGFERTQGDLSASSALAEHNALWLKIGGGVDYRITRAFFLRGELLWHWVFA